MSDPRQDSHSFRCSHLMPGLLLAATGVGAGDLLSAGLGGSECGLVLLWAALAGAVLKWFLSEGIARWHLGTDTTLMHGWSKLGQWTCVGFLVYLLIWSFFVGGALMSACGVAGTGILPLSNDPLVSKFIWGVAHSALGVVVVMRGGLASFEKVMSISIGVMVVAVFTTVLVSDPDWHTVASSAFIPRTPPGSLGWTFAVLGGVGGTVTLLSYGYWIRDAGRRGAQGLWICRIDLAVAYCVTALFGMSMIIVGSRVDITAGPTAAIALASALEQEIGPIGKWSFLLGFWGAVTSSLLGVWQSVPFIFADFVHGVRNRRSQPIGSLDKTVAYRSYLLAIAAVPVPLLVWKLSTAQQVYAITGAFFMPLLALTLLILNNRRDWIDDRFRNGPFANAALLAVLLVFCYLSFDTLRQKLWS